MAYIIEFDETDKFSEIDINDLLKQTGEVGIVLQWPKNEGETWPNDPHRLAFEHRETTDDEFEMHCSLPGMEVNRFKPEIVSDKRAHELIDQAIAVRGIPFRILACNPDLIDEE